ncbi:hypothetical protein ABIG06_003440 [Bradyrhizobium sp. USDA 326]
MICAVRALKVLESPVTSGCRHCEAKRHIGSQHRHTSAKRPDLCLIPVLAMRVAPSGTMIRGAVIIAAPGTVSQWLPKRSNPVNRSASRGKEKQLRGLVNQERRMGWTCNAHRYSAVLAAIAIAATWCTGYARARDRRAEEVLVSCKPDVIRFCDRFTGRNDADVAMFCLTENFKNLRRECRRMMPTAAADKSDRSRQSLNRRPVGLHPE